MREHRQRPPGRRGRRRHRCSASTALQRRSCRTPAGRCRPRRRHRRCGFWDISQDRAERDAGWHSPGGSDADPPPARQSRIGAPHPTPLRAQTSIAFDLRSTRCWFAAAATSQAQAHRSESNAKPSAEILRARPGAHRAAVGSTYSQASKHCALGKVDSGRFASQSSPMAMLGDQLHSLNASSPMELRTPHMS